MEAFEEWTGERVEKFLEDFKRLNIRPTSVLEVGGFRPTSHPLASHIGLAPVMRVGEEWPRDSEGRGMQFIAQLNLTEAPFVPEVLRDIALLTIFVGEECIERGFNPGSWELRAYPSLDGLSRVTAPPRPWRWLKGFECRWQQTEDYPSYDDDLLKLPDGYRLEDDLPEEMHGLNVHRSKVGGFASTIQYEVQFVPAIRTANGWEKGAEPPFALQIVSEEKAGLMWADNGVLYVGRRPETDEWFASCQFY
ncbi:DUF1963 domain-containing protein [Deinococcus apachensis]|uniref:DUF1963 domain-containing protein n=1 Tax=Deinococcus apachensis TaxID=309886 RepID=UPI00039BAF9A|nr:DUF1963 domain-containing protein [Deinococcus apachensis]